MEKFKKRLSPVLILVIVGSLFVTSCKQDDLSVAEKNLTSVKWKLTEFHTLDESFSSLFELMFALFDVTYDFKKDHTYVVTTKILFASESENGTWSLNAEGTHLTIDGESSEIISLTNKEMILGPNKKIMGSVADDEEEQQLEGFDNYQIVFKAK